MRRPCFTTRPSGCSGAGSAGRCPVIPSSSWYRSAFRPSCSPRSTAASWAASRQHDPHGRPHDHLRFAGRARSGNIESFGAWVALLIGSLVGIFVGIGLRLQTFLWMGLTTFVLDVVYEMGRVSLDYAFAKWAIMLALGIALGSVRRAQRKEADRQHDVALFRPGEVVGMRQS